MPHIRALPVQVVQHICLSHPLEFLSPFTFSTTSSIKARATYVVTVTGLFGIVCFPLSQLKIHWWPIPLGYSWNNDWFFTLYRIWGVELFSSPTSWLLKNTTLYVQSLFWGDSSIDWRSVNNKHYLHWLPLLLRIAGQRIDLSEWTLDLEPARIWGNLGLIVKADSGVCYLEGWSWGYNVPRQWLQLNCNHSILLIFAASSIKSKV